MYKKTRGCKGHLTRSPNQSENELKKKKIVLMKNPTYYNKRILRVLQTNPIKKVLLSSVTTNTDLGN